MRFILMKKEWEICPYETFFIAIGGSLFSMLIAIIGLVMYKSQTLNEILILYPLCTLGSVTVMMNLGNNSSTAKELFWGWIAIMVLFLAMAAWGWCLFTIFGVLK